MNLIYSITNKVNGKKYIGRTNNFKKRQYIHLYHLKKGTHHSIFLQRAFKKYGEENFVFEILLKNLNFGEVLKYEEEIILEEGYYNVSDKSDGGDLITNHPNREQIIEKMKTSMIERYSNMSDEDRKKLSERVKGEKNGMYGKNHSEETKKTMMINRVYKKGVDHHLYGKPMSDETKNKLSISKKGKIPWNKGKTLKPLTVEHREKLSQKLKSLNITHTSKPVICEGVEYTSVKEAANFYKITSAGLIVRLKSNTKKFKDFKYK